MPHDQDRQGGNSAGTEHPPPRFVTDRKHRDSDGRAGQRAHCPGELPPGQRRAAHPCGHELGGHRSRCRQVHADADPHQESRHHEQPERWAYRRQDRRRRHQRQAGDEDRASSEKVGEETGDDRGDEGTGVGGPGEQPDFPRSHFERGRDQDDRAAEHDEVEAVDEATARGQGDDAHLSLGEPISVVRGHGAPQWSCG